MWLVGANWWQCCTEVLVLNSFAIKSKRNLDLLQHTWEISDFTDRFFCHAHEACDVSLPIASSKWPFMGTVIVSVTVIKSDECKKAFFFIGLDQSHLTNLANLDWSDFWLWTQALQNTYVLFSYRLSVWGSPGKSSPVLPRWCITVSAVWCNSHGIIDPADWGKSATILALFRQLNLQHSYVKIGLRLL